MPRFFYSLLVIFLFTSAILVRIIFFTSPENKTGLVVFFIFLFLMLLTFFSLLPFSILARRSREINYQKHLLKKIFHYSALVSFFLTSLGILKVIGALSSLNLILLLILLISFEFFSSR